MRCSGGSGERRLLLRQGCGTGGRGRWVAVVELTISAPGSEPLDPLEHYLDRYTGIIAPAYYGGGQQARLARWMYPIE